MKLWGGRFKGEPDDEFARFNSSFSFDRRLLEVDIEASLAHAAALEEAEILTPDEAGEIQAGLNSILKRSRSEPAWLEQQDAEDVHSFVETELVRLIGNSGYKLHTGRSRNDQVATDLRLYTRREIDEALTELNRFQTALLDLAEKYPGAIIPGYTHLQRAQPILFPHYLLAYFEMIKRDRARFAEARARMNLLPLGSGALAGAGFPLNRETTARRLGFDGVCENSIDAVSDRDFVIEVVDAAALAMMHFSRFAEDLIIYATGEFGFVELSDAVSTGSSLMPQKRNPDALELIRGKAGRVFGHHAGLLATMKSLPLAYNKDMQEDKEPLFDALDTLRSCIRVFTTVLSELRLNERRARAAAAGGYSNATELADYLARKGIEFRLAHELVGRIVNHANERGSALENLSLDELRSFSPLIGEDVYRSLTLEAALAARSISGGTAPDRVREALGRARAEVGGS